MPYIDPTRRRQLDKPIDHLQETMTSPGDLAYVITRLGLQHDNKTFNDYATVIGVLEAVKLEFYRQQVAQYEDAKMFENGPVRA